MTSAKAAKLGARATAGAAIAHQTHIAEALLHAAKAANAQMLADKAQISPPDISLQRRDALLDGLESGAFVQVIRAGPAPPVGLVAISPSLVRLIASALSGAKPRENATPPSRIESALAELFAHKMLEHLGKKLTPSAGEDALAPQQNRRATQDSATLQSRLPDGSYAGFSLPFQLNTEDDDCLISIYFHLDFCNVLEGKSAAVQPARLGAEAQNWHRHMQNVALSAPIDARCIIDRFALPTRAVARLQRGDILPLPGLGLADISLELQHRSGTLAYGRGKLGASRRNKALQLHSLAEDTAPSTPRLSAPAKPNAD
ncbi:MAG: hypothetical protein WD046_07250 [Paracoccaceae bacterium]